MAKWFRIQIRAANTKGRGQCQRVRITQMVLVRTVARKSYLTCTSAHLENMIITALLLGSVGEDLSGLRLTEDPGERQLTHLKTD